ncbi:MAG: adenosylcobinamide-GDP ribazoletransferase [Campylobacterales bacterium]|nr:adenosylcobinamide-GDP ribazoletransferase [Campylobacterales bacterium]
MNNIYLGIKFALSYFTILPIGFKEGDDLSHSRVLSTMLYTLPFIGILLSSLAIGVFLLTEPLGWLGAILSAVAYMVLYGFIHTEAIFDVTDALYAAHSGKDPYLVIKEPTVGAMGVLYGVSFLILKIAALATLLMHHLFWEFVAIALISRLSLVWLIKSYTFRSSFVSQLRESLTLTTLLLLSGLTTVLGFWFLSFPFIALLGGGVLVSFLIVFLTRKSLGFINGDVLGMTLELVELTLLFAVLRLWS